MAAGILEAAMNEHPPIACDLMALKPEERERQTALAQALRSAVSSVREVAGGHEVTLMAGSAIGREGTKVFLRAEYGFGS